MKMLARADPQSANRIACHFGQQFDPTYCQLNDDGLERRVGVNGRHGSAQHVVKTQPGRRARRQYDFAGWNADTDSCIHIDVASRREQYASIERQLDESTIGVQLCDGCIEDAAESDGFP